MKVCLPIKNLLTPLAKKKSILEPLALTAAASATNAAIQNKTNNNFW